MQVESGSLETFQLPRSALLIDAADLEEGVGKKYTGYASTEC